MKKIRIIVTLIIWLMVTILTPYLIKYFFVNQETRNVLIDYMGSIYSGLMTIVGVIATIMYEKNERIKDIELQYRPQLKIEECDAANITTNGQLNIITDSNMFLKSTTEGVHKCLVIKNIGRGEMLDVELSDVEIESINDKIKFKGYICTGRNYDELGIEDYVTYSIVVPRRKTITYGNSELYNVSIKISFYGCLHKTKYQYLLSFCIDKKYGSISDKLYNYKVIKLDKEVTFLKSYKFKIIKKIEKIEKK